MSRIVSAFRRVVDNELAQDICALLATGGFIFAAFYVSAGIVMWRAGL